ncbi:hypothetical protein AKJ51_04030 [candidate division MSBL1 archaeon SCGC-AAA382A20]|uniref:Proliferating cell nuclear antigen PCNA N-terminal domain-containing protein n=1 Tax=candidate division MSBL1 archaeon SCGC-AAA382A20 TaxID=1698280 RepID=A0A133VIF7_9EURY|nr:hypothetical protein AKJ51_04030 [candidate division MSBL1 archaeon SCGC-AAA382A20]
MKIKTKIGKLKHLLEKTSCNKLFEPVAMKLLPGDNKIVVQKDYEGEHAIELVIFNDFEIEGDKEMIITLDASDLLKQIKVIPDSHDSDIEIKDGSMIINTPREDVYYHLNENWDSDEDYYHNIPILAKKGTVFLVGNEETPFPIKAKVDSSELNEMIKRMKINDANFITFKGEDSKLKAEIGKLTSQKYHPRKYDPEGEMIEGEGATSVAVGIAEIAPILEGKVELHYIKNGPLAIYDEDESDAEDYSALYMIAPAGEMD